MARHTLQDHENNEFFQMPKFLLSEEFRGLTNDARMLYAILKDRHKLSIKNGWVDKDGHIFMYCTREEMSEFFDKDVKTITKYFDMLVKYKLIEKVKQGQGKADRIYLLTVNIGEGKKSHQEREKLPFKKGKNFTSEKGKIPHQERENLPSNNTNINKTEYSKTENNNTYMSAEADDGATGQSNFDYQSFLNEYHKVCVSLPRVQTLNVTRKRNIRHLVKFLQNNQLDLNMFLGTVESSDFLTGRNNKWSANFDWIIKQSNYIKIIEGNYVNKTDPPPTNNPSAKSTHSKYMDIIAEMGGSNDRS